MQTNFYLKFIIFLKQYEARRKFLPIRFAYILMISKSTTKLSSKGIKNKKSKKQSWDENEIDDGSFMITPFNHD